MTKRCSAIVLIILMMACLGSCVTDPSTNLRTGAESSGYLPAGFSTENIMKVNSELTSEDVHRLFGSPKSISQAICGGAIGRTWSCTTWEYGEFPYDKASFTFAPASRKLRINSFEIHRQGIALPDSFSTENMMKVHQGMSHKEILNMFGNPVSVSQAVCGGRSGRIWICTSWEYGDFPYSTARFTFSGKGEKLMLNDFEINRR
jgi:outer membrane protein assembly factor BamE (lipoprotein component of BamABCDE complex)